jgi:hypothetical protein
VNNDKEANHRIDLFRKSLKVDFKVANSGSPGVLKRFLSKDSTQDFAVFLIDDQLCFQMVVLFFIRVAVALFFWGRSILVSVTSTMTTSKSASAPLPGLAARKSAGSNLEEQKPYDQMTK